MKAVLFHIRSYTAEGKLCTVKYLEEISSNLFTVMSSYTKYITYVLECRRLPFSHLSFNVSPVSSDTTSLVLACSIWPLQYEQTVSFGCQTALGHVVPD